jgi:hypothetical protein
MLAGTSFSTAGSAFGAPADEPDDPLDPLDPPDELVLLLLLLPQAASATAQSTAATGKTRYLLQFCIALLFVDSPDSRRIRNPAQILGND